MGKTRIKPNNRALEKRVDQIRAKIRSLRKEKRITAAVMAERMGISRPFYTQLEGGTRRLSVYYLLGIAKALGVEAEELIRVEG